MGSEETAGQGPEQVSQKIDFELSRADYERVFRWVPIWRHKWKRVYYPVLVFVGLVLLGMIEFLRRQSIDVPAALYFALVVAFGFPVYMFWFLPFWISRSLFRPRFKSEIVGRLGKVRVVPGGWHSNGNAAKVHAS